MLVRDSIAVAALVGVVCLLGSAAAAAAESSADVDFDRDIKPLFARHCYECHGADKQESGLRLDQRGAALRGGDLGHDIVPGKSDDSRLVTALLGASEVMSRMPPEGEPLTADQIALVRRWIDAGAAWPENSTAGKNAGGADHWAFRAPVRPPLPAVKNSAWVQNDIDRFILARLEAEGLAPSPPADRVTLLRRLSLDLIGLPPTIEEVDSFLADTSPQAFDKQIERLLASPHYGERWGRHWLDAARYADSDGFEKDKSRNVWMYRDWVVAALNRDLPYDQFVIEQLAGDQLPGATQDQIVATGFLRNSMLNEEGGIDPEQFRMEAMFDRMDALGKSVLGLTIQCAQCHSHKYDPISQQDYYRLFAFLNNDHESQPTVYTPAEMIARDALVREMQTIEAELRHAAPDWAERMAAWEKSASAPAVEWHVLKPEEFLDTGGGAKLERLADDSLLCAGYAPTHCTFRVTGRAELPKTTALRLELLTDANLPRGGPGRSFKGTCALSQISVTAKPLAGEDKPAECKIAAATADFEQPEAPLEPAFDDRSGKERKVGPVAWAIDGKKETAWGIDAGAGRRNQDRKAVFRFEKPIEFAAGAELAVSFLQDHGGWNSDDHQNNLLGRFRISVTAAEGEVAADPLPRRVRELLAVPREQRTDQQTAEIFSYWRTTVPEWRAANERIESLWAQWPAGTTALVLGTREMQRETHMLRRGDFLKPGDRVAAGVPAALHPLPADAGPTRLSLARWLVDRQSPTTARVAINRVWQAYFGTGIVATSEDFGTQSDPPSHPQLLDWLACEFMERGYHLKDMHRLIARSATYQQSSRVVPEVYERDPLNRLLARGPRFRVEGEIVRDIALAASGKLNPKLGGPSIFAPVPESLLALSYAPLTWNEERGADRYRRALYTFRRRSLPYPALQNFDTPNGDFSCVRRQRSNTPLQALTTLNEVIFTECARALARRTLEQAGGSDAERIGYAFRSCVSRQPTAEEQQVLLQLLDSERKRIAEGWTDARQIVSGQSEVPADLPAGATPAQWAAYTVVARVILNLDETITKE
ncbi:MAG: PSD1 and planctomycete cytochrome C domain-containing protein [Pirellulales bacterium]